MGDHPSQFHLNIQNLTICPPYCASYSLGRPPSLPANIALSPSPIIQPVWTCPSLTCLINPPGSPLTVCLVPHIIFDSEVHTLVVAAICNARLFVKFSVGFDGECRQVLLIFECLQDPLIGFVWH